MAIKITMKYHYTLTRMPKKKRLTIPSVDGYVGLSHIGSAKRYNHCEELSVSYKAECTLTI